MIIHILNLNVRVRVRIIATLFMGKILSKNMIFFAFFQLMKARFSKVYNYSVTVVTNRGDAAHKGAVKRHQGAVKY